MTPDQRANLDRLDAWRALTEARQAAWFEAEMPREARARLDAVSACPDRGGVLPISQQPQDCARCGELSLCRAGKGTPPGRVTLRDCLGCVGH